MPGKKTYLFVYITVWFLISAQSQSIGLYHFEEFDLAHKAGVPGVYSMFQDTTGVIWLGSTNGIYRYDGSRIFEFDQEQKKLLGKTNYSFLQAKNGDVIIGSDYGICRYSIKHNSIKPIVHLNRVFNDRSRYYPVCFDEYNNLWFVASGKGIGMYNGSLISWVKNPKTFPDEAVSKLSDAFFDHHTGNMYLANFAGTHTVIFNINKRSFALDSTHNTVSFELINSVLYRIESGNILATNLINSVKNQFKHQGSVRISENALYSKTVVSDGEWLWISLRDGVLPFNYRKGHYGNLIGFDGDTKGTLIRHISELFNDKEGNIWVCTETNGIKILNRNHLRQFQHLSDMKSSNNIIMDIEPINDSLLLICPLVQAPRLVNIYTNFHHAIFSESNVESSSFNATRLDETFILLTRQSGDAYTFNSKNMQLKKLNLPIRSFIKIITTSQKDIFLIYTGQSLTLFKFDNESLLPLKSISVSLPSENILYNPFTNCVHLNNQVQSLVIDARTLNIIRSPKPEFGAFMDSYWDKDKTLWIGTRAGLLHYNLQNKLIESFNTSNGLNNDVVYAIHPNSDSTLLYLSTNLGISVFSLSTKKIRNYTIADGLPESEHNGAATAFDGKGNFYFGNIKGVTVFNESINTANAGAPFLIIQSITVDDTTYNMTENPNYTKSIHIYPQNDVFGINFSLLSTSNPNKLIYSYKIEGIDKNFYHSSVIPNIRISKPRPGTYTLVLRGETEGGTFVEKRIQLIIHAPFYLKWWFLLPVILLFHTMVYFIIKRIIKNRLKKKQQEIDTQRIIYEQKSQIARELHDNVGARLSMMLNTVDWIEKKPFIELSDLNEIKDNTKAVIQGLRDAIWVMDKTQITAEELFDKIKYYSNQITRNYPVALTFNEVTHKTLILTTTQALNLFRIVQESLNNALKYANASSIEITLSYEDDNGIVLKISDNGTGFNPQDIIQGHGLKNMQRRADEINALLNLQSTINEGTIITITLYIV